MTEQTKPRSSRRSPGPLYLILFCSLIIAILIVNGYFEINRTRLSLTDILENQGETLLRVLEREIQNTISVIEVMEQVPGSILLNTAASARFFSLEDAIVDYLLETATEVDQKDAVHPLTERDLEALARDKEIEKIQIVRAPSQPGAGKETPAVYRPLFEGTRYMVIVPFEEIVPDEEDLFSVAIRRTEGDGIAAVSMNGSQMRHLRRKLAVADVIESTEFGEDIQYVSVLDTSLSLIAGIKSDQIGEIIDPDFLQSVRGETSAKSRFRSTRADGEVFEIAKTIPIQNDPFGILMVGLSTAKIQTMLHRSKRNVLFSITVLLALSIVGVTLIYANQSRHLRKLKEMEARAQASERLLSIGKLGAGLAHEIRNPLNAIAMAIQRLQREFSPQDDTRTGEYGRFVEVIREEINRLNHIVDQFIFFSKPHKLTLAPETVAEILDNLSVLFAEEAQSRSVVIHNEMDPRLPAVRMDKRKITQALINIVTNSFHAMDDGGGTLTIRAKRDRKDQIKITVSDTGRGIPQEKIEKVFDHAYTTREKGLGLGLPIAHKIIEEHGGRIEIESREGQGTTVSIHLPAEGP